LNRPRLLLVAAVFYPLLAAGALAWSAARTGRMLPPGLTEGRPLASLLLGAALAAAVLWVSGWLMRRPGPVRRLGRTLAAHVGPVSAAEAAGIAGLSAVGEELLFRGTLQPAMGYIAASLLFGLAHFVPGRGWRAYPLFAGAMGFLFGGLVLATGNLLGAILAHGWINHVNLLRIARMRPAV
jgi:membrane protease YdiL (CAAX protease family)